MRTISLKDATGRDWMDFSSLSSYMRCPRQYYWRYVQHITRDVEAVALINGGAYHDCKAEYYLCRKAGAGFEEALSRAIIKLREGMSKIMTDDPKRNMSVAEKTMTQYLEIFGDDYQDTVEVEVPFAVDLEEFLYVGRIDRIVNNLFGLCVEETKTTTIVGTRWGDRTDPNAQLDGYVSAYYILTGEMPWGAVLDVIPVTTFERVRHKGNKPFRLPTPRTMEDVEAWAEDARSWWNKIAQCKKEGYFSRNTESCTPLLGFKCEFTTLCELYKNPHRHESLDLVGEYKVEAWAPFPELLEEKEDESNEGNNREE